MVTYHFYCFFRNNAWWRTFRESFKEIYRELCFLRNHLNITKITTIDQWNNTIPSGRFIFIDNPPIFISYFTSRSAKIAGQVSHNNSGLRRYLSVFRKETKSPKTILISLRWDQHAFFSVHVGKLRTRKIKNSDEFTKFWSTYRCEISFQMTACQFWSNHSEYKVILNQSNELAYVNRAHSPSDQLMAFFTSRFQKEWKLFGGL